MSTLHDIRSCSWGVLVLLAVARAGSAEVSLTEYPVPAGGWIAPYGIAAGADGALWFTEQLGNKIGRITTSGGLTEYSLPAGPLISTSPFIFSNLPWGIASGPDGAL